MASLIEQLDIHTVLFDAGGTLVDSPSFFDFLADQVDGSSRDRLAAFLKQRFFELFQHPEAEFRPIRELLRSAFADAATALGIPDHSGRAHELYRSLFVEHAGLFPDVLPVLDYLDARGVRLIMISDADADVLYAELDKFGIRNRFEAFIISSEVRAYKPGDPIVAAAEKYCRGPRERILLVGDDEVDILTAKRLGVKAAAVHQPRGAEFGADFVLERLSDLIIDRDVSA